MNENTTFEPDPLDRACALHERSVEEREERKFDEALRHDMEALALFEEFDDPESPDVANILSNLGGIYVDLARYPEAEAHFQRAVAIMDGLPAADDADVMMVHCQALRNLGDLYRIEGRYSEA